MEKDGCYFVLPGFFQFEDLFIVKEGPSVSVPSSTQERVTLMQAVLVHHFRNTSSGVEELANVLPLFQLEVLTLPAGMACICLSISHMLVDGPAYHTVVQLISDALQEKDITPMNWEIVDQQFHTKYGELLWLPCCLMELAKRKFTGFKRPTSLFIVDAEKCTDLKKSLKRDSSYLSTNDVVVAAMAEVLPGRTTMVVKNMRKKIGRAHV